MPLYGGIDLHANHSVVVLLNEQDQVIYQRRLPNHLPTIVEHLVHATRDMLKVMSARILPAFWSLCKSSGLVLDLC
jgi:hypothetical protein